MVNPIANHVRLKTFGWRRCYTLKKLDEKLDEKKMWLHWTEPQYLWQLGEAPPKSCQKVAKCQRHFQPRKYGHFSTGNLVAWHRWWAHHDSAFATFINIMEYQCFMHIQSYTSLHYRCTVFCGGHLHVCIYIYTHHMMCSVFLGFHMLFYSGETCCNCPLLSSGRLELEVTPLEGGDACFTEMLQVLSQHWVLGWSSVGDSQKDVENPPWM